MDCSFALPRWSTSEDWWQHSVHLSDLQMTDVSQIFLFICWKIILIKMRYLIVRIGSRPELWFLHCEESINSARWEDRVAPLPTTPFCIFHKLSSLYFLSWALENEKFQFNCIMFAPVWFFTSGKWDCSFYITSSSSAYFPKKFEIWKVVSYTLNQFSTTCHCQSDFNQYFQSCLE